MHDAESHPADSRAASGCSIKLSFCSRRCKTAARGWTAANLDAEGNPRKELFLKEGLHPDEKGYRIWAERIRPYLETTVRGLSI